MRQATLASSLARSAGSRLFGVFWGSLVVIDLARLAHMPPAAGTAAVVLVVALASWRQPSATVLMAAGMGWTFVNGFVVNQLGQLRWDGFPDLERLLLLTAVALMAGWAGDPDGFSALLRRRRGLLQVRPQVRPSGPPDSVGRERHAVGR